MTDTTISAGAMPPAHSYQGDELAQSHPVSDKTELSAQSRLEASRARVRAALMEVSHPPKRPSLSTGVIDKLLATVKDVPGITLVLDAAKSWWDDHGQTAQSAGQASQVLIAPVARRHPAGLVGIAGALGALLMLLRPWRLLLRRKILFGAASLIATQVIRSRSANSWPQTGMKFAPRKARY